MTAPWMKPPRCRTILGLDIGGANLKAAHTGGDTVHMAFPLWKDPAALRPALAKLLGGAPAFDRIGVTMTGELCDCFASKREGVLHILAALEAEGNGRPIHVWTNEGRFVSLEQARAKPLPAASANWLALATWVAPAAPKGVALLIDIGTTTTDIIPLVDGKPAPKGRTDRDRLACSELVYRGWKRTPLCAMIGPERAAEFFATMHDAMLVLRKVPEEPNNRDTPDGQPATRAAANRRLARMLCADLETSTARQCQELAEEVVFRLVSQISMAVEKIRKRLPGPIQTVISSGSGEFIVPAVLGSILIDFGNMKKTPSRSLGAELSVEESDAACALAVARLLDDQEASA